MDIDPGLLLIILFIVAPLLERLFKAGKKQVPPEPPQQRQRRVPPPRPRPEERQRVPDVEDEGEGSAADMLPEDLWAILTGERPARREEPKPAPPPARPQPQPRTASTRRQQAQAGSARERRLPPVQKRRLPPVDMRTELPPDEEAAIPREAPTEVYPVEGYVREIPVHEAPEVVSLEQLEFDDEKRHARFHQKIAELRGTAPTARRPAAHPLKRLLRKRDDVRQAIVLREVLGPPKGLD